LLVVLGVAGGSVWPAWLYVALTGLGFFAPGLVLQPRLKQRRQLIVAELPQAVDLLGVSVLTGQSLQPAVIAGPAPIPWPLSIELEYVQRQLRLGHATVREALEGVATRNQVPELTRTVEALVSVYAANLPAASGLEQMAAGLRHERLQQIVESG